MIRPLLVLLASALPTLALAAAPAPAPSCYDAPSQGALNQCAANEFKDADARLNRTWKAIQAKYADSPLFLAKLKLAQQRWLAFRDAELEARMPLAAHADPTAEYGSVYPMCVGQIEAELTQQRVKQLQAWLDGVEEGEMCAGSIKNSAEVK